MAGSGDSILRSLRRDRGLPLAEIFRKTHVYVLARAAAPLWLRECTRVGPGARTVGRPRVVNRGIITIGRDVNIVSDLGIVELAADRGARLEIGDGCFVNFGTCIRASEGIAIGNGVGFGPWCAVRDVPDPWLPGAGGDAVPRPISIGDGAWLGARVTVMPGVRIGARATVAAGSVVATDLPDDAVAAGDPARVLRVAPARRAEGERR